MALGDIIRVTVVATAEAQVGLNVHHYKVTAQTGTGATYAEMADIVEAGLALPFRNCMSGQAVYRGIILQRIFPAPPTEPVYDTGGAGIGGIASDMLPKQVAGVITKRTGLAGRRYRGRCYVPFMAEEHNNGLGAPTPAGLAQLNLYATAINTVHSAGTAPNTSILTPVLLNADGPGATRPFTSVVARKVFGTQRRRGDFGRINPNPIP